MNVQDYLETGVSAAAAKTYHKGFVPLARQSLVVCALPLFLVLTAGAQANSDPIEDHATSEPATSADSASNPAPINGKIGYRVQLAGSGTAAAGQRLNWRFADAPAGSDAQIVDSSTPDAYFVPDEQGVYVVEGTASGDTVTETVTVGPAKTLTPLQSRVLKNGVYNIIVDGVEYPGPANPGAAGTNVVLLDRGTLELRDHKTFTGNAVIEYLKGVLANKSYDVLAIISTNDAGPGFALKDLAPQLKGFGANNDFDVAAGTLAFSLIGTKGTSIGQAYQVAMHATNLAGYLAPDASAKYAFIQNDYLTFKVTPSKNLTDPSVVSIEGVPVLLSNPAGCAGGGFFVGILSRATLEPAFRENYCTQAATAQLSIEAQRALRDRLSQFARPGSPLSAASTNYDALVFLVSFGQIHNGFHLGAPNFAQLSYFINFVGGTYEAIYNVNAGDTYSLVTSPDPGVMPLEAGSKIEAGSSGEQEGVLGRSRVGNRYAPVAGTTAVGVPNLDLFRILAQPPKTFPIPREGDNEQAREYSEISKAICSCGSTNVRTAYENLNIGLGVYYTNLKTLVRDPLNPGAAPCNDDPTPGTPFCIVRAQLLTELQYASHIREFYSNIDLLWTAKNSNIGLILTDVTNKVNESIRVAPSSLVSPLVTDLVTGFAGLASYVPVVGNAVGIANSLFSIGLTLANASAGNNTSLDVTVPAGELGKQAAANFALQKVATGVTFHAIYEDWGKLRDVGDAITEQDPRWKWNSTTSGLLLNTFNIAAERADYQSLIPAVYVTRYWNVDISGGSTIHGVPSDYLYWGFLDLPFPIFAPGTPSVNFLTSPSPRRTKQGVARNDILTMSIGGRLPAGIGTHYQTLDSNLVGHLIDPLSEGGLGVWKPALVRHWLPILWCGPSFGRYINGPSNCEYSTVQLPLLTIGATADVSMDSSLNPARVGSTVSFLAKVTTESGRPETGMVQFTVNGKVLGDAQLHHGEAALTTSNLPLGNNIIVASYFGNPESQSSNSPPLVEIVNPE